MTATNGAVTFLDDLRTIASAHEQDRRALAERRPGLRGIHQTRFGTRPPFTDTNLPGNCTQAAVATLLGLDLDDTPDFVELTIADPRPDAWWYVFTSWSEDRFDVGWLSIEPEQIADVAWETDPATILLLGGGRSPRGPWGHSVVIDGNLDLVWDPNPGGDGVSYLTDVCVPIHPKPFGTGPTGDPLYRMLDLTERRP